MTAAVTTPGPVWSGHCGIGRHQQCRGLYAGHPCPCDCHTEAEPEPEPEPEPALTPSSPRRHCATCSCGEPR